MTSYQGAGKGEIKMLKEIALTRPWFMKKMANADPALATAGALRAQARPATAGTVSSKLSSEIGVVLVGAGFFGLAAVINTGDPKRNILLF